MSCAETRPLLAHRPLDALDDDELGGVDAHLAECNDCATYLDALDGAYAELEGDPIAAELPDGLWAGIVQRLDEDEDEEEPAPSGGIELAIALVCIYCHDALTRPEARYCASCLAPHHADCFRAHGTCAAPGCDETHVVQPTLGGKPDRRSPGEPIRRLGLVASALAATIGLGGIAALRVRDKRASDQALKDAAAEADYQKQRSLEREQQSRLVMQAARQRAELLERDKQDARDRLAREREARRVLISRPVYLGVRLDSVLGLRFGGVPEGSVAAQAGLHSGDRILQVNGEPVSTRAEFDAYMSLVGERFTLKVERYENPTLEVRVTIPLLRRPPKGVLHATALVDGLAVSSQQDLTYRTAFVDRVYEVERTTGRRVEAETLGRITFERRVTPALDSAGYRDAPAVWQVSVKGTTVLPKSGDLWLDFKRKR